MLGTSIVDAINKIASRNYSIVKGNTESKDGGKPERTDDGRSG
jgi:hypothetical protein